MLSSKKSHNKYEIEDSPEEQEGEQQKSPELELVDFQEESNNTVKETERGKTEKYSASPVKLKKERLSDELNLELIQTSASSVIERQPFYGAQSVNTHVEEDISSSEKFDKRKKRKDREHFTKESSDEKEKICNSKKSKRNKSLDNEDDEHLSKKTEKLKKLKKKLLSTSRFTPSFEIGSKDEDNEVARVEHSSYPEHDKKPKKKRDKEVTDETSNDESYIEKIKRKENGDGLSYKNEITGHKSQGTENVEIFIGTKERKKSKKKRNYDNEYDTESTINESSITTSSPEHSKKPNKRDKNLTDETSNDESYVEKKVKRKGKNGDRVSYEDEITEYKPHKEKEKPQSTENVENFAHLTPTQNFIGTEEHKKSKKKRNHDNEHGTESTINESSITTSSPEHYKKPKKKRDKELPDETSNDESYIEKVKRKGKNGDRLTYEDEITRYKPHKEKKRPQSAENVENFAHSTPTKDFNGTKEDKKSKKKRDHDNEHDTKSTINESSIVTSSPEHYKKPKKKKDNELRDETSNDESHKEMAKRKGNELTGHKPHKEKKNAQSTENEHKKSKKKIISTTNKLNLSAKHKEDEGDARDDSPPVPEGWRKGKSEVNLKQLFTSYEYDSDDFPTPKKYVRRISVFVEQTEGEEDLQESDTGSLADSGNENRAAVDISVMLLWPTAPLHKIETRVATRPSEKQRKQIENLDIKVKIGPYSNAEDDIIRENWSEFYRSHDLPNDATPFLRFADDDRKVNLPLYERIRFVRFLAHGLNNRLLASVYSRFKRLFRQRKQTGGRFTPEEDKTILDFIKRTTSTTPYSELAKLLNRDKLAIEKRCIKLSNIIQQKSKKVKWNLAKIEEFIKHLVDITNVPKVEDLQERNILPEEWKELSQRLNVPVVKLRRAWTCTIYHRLFIEHKIHYNKLQECLIRELFERNETDWKMVDWDAYAKEFVGFTGVKLNHAMKQIVHYHVPKRKRTTLGESLNYLVNVFLKEKGFRSKTLRKLQIIDRRDNSDA